MTSKVGIGSESSDLEASINQRGTEVTVAVEVKDSEGNQINDFGGGGDTMTNGQQAVTDSETSIIAASSSNKGSIITNHSDNVTVFIGTTGVTVSNGFELGPRESVPIPTLSAIVGITISGTAVIGFLSFT